MILIIFIAAGSIGAVVILSKKNPSTTLTTHSKTIVNGTANVNASAYTDYLFTIPSGATNIHVTGTFTVQGNGSIDVYIFDSTNFAIYKNGGDFGPLYQSGQINTATIDANLYSSGKYYLVLDNLFPPIEQKTVNIQTNVTYLAP